MEVEEEVQVSIVHDHEHEFSLDENRPQSPIEIQNAQISFDGESFLNNDNNLSNDLNQSGEESGSDNELNSDEENDIVDFEVLEPAFKTGRDDLFVARKKYIHNSYNFFTFFGSTLTECFYFLKRVIQIKFFESKFIHKPGT